MQVVEARKVRRLMVRLEQGEELVQSLIALSEAEGIGAAWIRGAGQLRWVELDRHHQELKKAEPPQRFDQPCEVLSLEGTLIQSKGKPVVTLHASLSRRTDNGVGFLGGRVCRAEVFNLELFIECLEGVELSLKVDPALGLAVWSGRAREGAEVSTSTRLLRAARTSDVDGDDEEDDADQDELEDEDDSPPAVSWAEVAAASAASSESDPVPPQPAPVSSTRGRSPRGRGSAQQGRSSSRSRSGLTPQKGDWVHHRQFGMCRVDRESGEGALVIRLPSGIRKTIRLDFMDVGQPRREGDRRVFPLRPRR